MLTGRRHIMYVVKEVLEPLRPAVAIRFPGDTGSGLRPGIKTYGEVEVSLVQELRVNHTADGRGEIMTVLTLDFDIVATNYIHLIEYKDLVIKRIEDVSMPDYVMLGDYSDYDDPASPDRIWNLMEGGGPIVNINPSSRKDTAYAARDRRRDDSVEKRRKEEFTIVLSMC